MNTTNKKGLEIGALNIPLLTKSDAEIYFADIVSQKDFGEHFKKYPGIEQDNVVKLDFELSPNLSFLEQTKMSFDFVIANHVLEHAPNPIKFLKQIEEILVPDGILFLTLPDKRYTFDINRQLTPLEHLLDDYYRDATNTEFQHIFRLFSSCTL